MENIIKRCGNCLFWMTQDCPREPKNRSTINIFVMNNCERHPCEKYEISHLYIQKTK